MNHDIDLLISNYYRWGCVNKNISNEGVKELAVNISKLTNLIQLDLNLDR